MNFNFKFGSLFVALVVCVLPYANATSISLANITWANKLDTQADLTSYLKGKHQMALESVIVVTNGNDSHVIMGNSPSGALTVLKCVEELRLFNDGKEKEVQKGIKFNITTIAAYDQLVSDLSSTGSFDWMIIHFDFFRGPAGGEPTLNPKDFKTHVLEMMPADVVLSFGMARSKSTDMGYCVQELVDLGTDWKTHGFAMLSKPIDFVVYIVHLVWTSEEILKRVNDDLKMVGRIEMRLSETEVDKALERLDVFRGFMNRMGISRTFMNAPDRFRKAYFLDDKDAGPTDPDPRPIGSGCQENRVRDQVLILVTALFSVKLWE